MPFGIKAFSQFSLPEVHLRKSPDFPSLPVAKIHIMKNGLGSTFQVRYVLRDPLFPRISWNHDHHAPEPYYSQIKFWYFGVFSSGKCLIKINDIRRSRGARVVDKTKPAGSVSNRM
jgi:hypothetical protein